MKKRVNERKKKKKEEHHVSQRIERGEEERGGN